MEHNRKGNCWDAAYDCAACGNSLCDVCHKHDEPRGECTVCPACQECERQDREAERPLG